MLWPNFLQSFERDNNIFIFYSFACQSGSDLKTILAKIQILVFIRINKNKIILWSNTGKQCAWSWVQSHCATSMPRRPYFILLRCHSTSLEDSEQWDQSLFEVAFEYIYCIFFVTFPLAKSKNSIIIRRIH